MNNSLLFHYTSADGAIGIIENKCLWATDIRFLNDSEEFIHGCKLVKKIVKKLQLGETSHEFNEKFLSFLLASVESLVNDDNSLFTSYIISFSTQNDSLNQWRAYSGDSGYALGWEIDKLRKLTKLRNAKLVKCIYEENEQLKFVERIIKFAAHKIKNIKDDAWIACINSFAIKYILQRFMPRLKHKAFKDEQEWRIVVTSEDTIKFRTGRLGITPYVVFSMKNSVPNQEAINIFSSQSTIFMPNIATIGPCENIMLSKIGLEQLIKAHGNLFTFKKTLSEIPYRHMKK
jgi:hypothetical protein